MHKDQREDPALKKLYESVPKLPKDLSQESLRAALPEILDLIGKTRRQFLPELRMAVYELGTQPNLLAALQDHYRTTPASNYYRRYLVLQLVGELQKPDALPFLKDVATAPLPPQTASAESLSPRDDEVAIQMKAVHGVGFIRDGSGLPMSSAFGDLLQIARTHPDRVVRIAAIDTYMWNHPDKQEAAATLNLALSEEYRPFISRVRFYRGAALETFSRRK